MDRSDVIQLVSVTRAQDALGVWRETTTTREVFCKAESVTRAEFFEGGRNGLNPEYKFVLFFGDYAGEQTVAYKGVVYGVYRTFHASTDVLELYVEKKTGAVVEDLSDGEADTGGTA